jgi:glycosyltransferase involved in cell wall biosynthesis
MNRCVEVLMHSERIVFVVIPKRLATNFRLRLPRARPVLVFSHAWIHEEQSGWFRARSHQTAGHLVGLLPKLLRRYRPDKVLRDAYLRNGFRLPLHEIRFGVDISRAPKPLRDPKSPVRFGFVGQLAPHKGPDILIQAFRELPPLAAELDIFGPEEQDPEYMGRLRTMAQNSKVHFRGTFPPESMTDILSGLDFLVIPSRWYENSPLVLLNALATHTPVIISDVEGMTEFVTEGDNGYIFRRGDAGSLAAVLQIITKDPARARRMSETTEYNRTTEIMTKEVLDVYQSVLVQQRSDVTLDRHG